MADGQIDVVSDFIYDAHNQQYNSDYKTWRQHTSAPCAYRCVADTRESIYVAGKSVPKRSAKQTERRALSWSAEVIGAALLILMICGLGGASLLVWILRQFGMDIQIDFLTLSMRGNQWMVSAVRMFCELLKFGIPLCILIRMFRLPARIVLPRGFGGLASLIAAIGFGAVCSAVHALPAHNAAVELMQTVYTYKEPEAILAYATFDVLVVSVLSELLLRGAMLPVLRQFGDLFAVSLTACIAFLFPAALPSRLGELLIGLAAGYLMLRSGSLWDCIILRVIYAALRYAKLWLVYTNNTLTLAQYFLILLCGGIVCILLFVLRRRGRLLLRNRVTMLSLREKLLAFTQTITSLPWLAASALVALLQLFY